MTTPTRPEPTGCIVCGHPVTEDNPLVWVEAEQDWLHELCKDFFTIKGVLFPDDPTDPTEQEAH